MSAFRSFVPAPRSAPEASGRRRPSTVCALAIYLAALALPGLGSTLAWAGVYVWTRDPSLAAHHRRALLLQLPCLLVMVALQASVIALLALLALCVPVDASVELRHAIVFAGLHLSAGAYLLTGLLGPVELLAGRPSAPVVSGPAVPARVRAPTRVASPTRKVPSG